MQREFIDGVNLENDRIGTIYRTIRQTQNEFHVGRTIGGIRNKYSVPIGRYVFIEKFEMDILFDISLFKGFSIQPGTNIKSNTSFYPFGVKFMIVYQHVQEPKPGGQLASPVGPFQIANENYELLYEETFMFNPKSDHDDDEVVHQYMVVKRTVDVNRRIQMKFVEGSENLWRPHNCDIRVYALAIGPDPDDEFIDTDLFTEDRFTRRGFVAYKMFYRDS
jgi:hypothetical protein